MAAADETQAAEYRAQAARRAAAQRARCALLAGSASARADLGEAWKPLDRTANTVPLVGSDE